MLFLQAAAPEPATALEARLLEHAAAELRSQVRYPPATRVRRVHFMRSTGTDGRDHLHLCGEARDEGAPPTEDWTPFVTSEINGEIQLWYGGGAYSPSRACTGRFGQLDFRRDFSARLEHEVRR
ncbi:hypothetical protein [Sphingosinicella sp.]|uniref:hypothetical protein n=1 Tax=Sphingosinicella sp. TaxID=1917971 RepID=UPI004037DCC7